MLLFFYPFLNKFVNDLVESLAWPPALAAQLQVTRSPVHLHVFPAPEQYFFKGTVSRVGLSLIVARPPVHLHVFPAPEQYFFKGTVSRAGLSSYFGLVARAPPRISYTEYYLFKVIVSRAGLALILAWSPVHLHVFPARDYLFKGSVSRAGLGLILAWLLSSKPK